MAKIWRRHDLNFILKKIKEGNGKWAWLFWGGGGFTFDVAEQSLDAGAELTSRLVIVAIIQLDTLTGTIK